MVNFKESLIWRAAFETDEAQAHRTSVDKLIQIFDQVRENAKVLVGEIATDLPKYTVHDIEHLDALWETASQIVGDGFQLNPVEGFILGCSFLFHDAAMTVAAYPAGIPEIKKSKEWVRLSNRVFAERGKEVDDAFLLDLFLREQHAVRAEQLPRLSWKSDIGDRYLIDEADARERFGRIIGELAGSHWWDHQKVEMVFSQKMIPAPAPFPSSWSIDLLKLACVLRTADVSQLDERRAPGFLRALRSNKLTDDSIEHWKFQNKLSQAQRRDDALFFASLRPFKKDEATAWWLLYDTLKLVDRELRKTDDLLGRCRGQTARLAARRVSNIEAPESMRVCVHTEDWVPVDTAFSVADIPKLIENLGGDQLYGLDRTVAIRELVQNGMDAVRLRLLVDPEAQPPLVKLEIKEDGAATVLTVRDNGVGMSETALVDKLLSFGKSGWLSDEAIGEYSDKLPEKMSVSGRFGIGFFSIFMIAKSVVVKSRRFDASPDQTVLLTFNDGLYSRPLLSHAEHSDRMTAGGTEILVVLDTETIESIRLDRAPYNLSFHAFVSRFEEIVSDWFPTSEIPLQIVTPSKNTNVDGSKWQTEPAVELLKRVEGGSYKEMLGEHPEQCLTLVIEDDNTVVGRATFRTRKGDSGWRSSEDAKGIVASQGAKISTGHFRGIMLGTPTRAARDTARLRASSNALRKWSTEQAQLLQGLSLTGSEQADVAQSVAGCGGDIGELKFCELGGQFHNRTTLRELLHERDEIWVAQEAAVILADTRLANWSRSDNCISVETGSALISSDTQNYHTWLSAVSLADITKEIIAEVFSLDQEVIDRMELVEDGYHVYRAPCPAWVRSDGGERVFVDGSYFKRGMTLADVEAFFRPEEIRKTRLGRESFRRESTDF